MARAISDKGPKSYVALKDEADGNEKLTNISSVIVSYKNNAGPSTPAAYSLHMHPRILRH
jgi:hypothetical protein